MTNRFLGVFFHWLPIGGTIVALFGFTYLAVQQNYRSSLNDPQIQMTEDAQARLLGGAQPAEVVPRGTSFDIEKSLSPFIAVYDESGNPLESSGFLRNAPPRPPIGVFEYAKESGENRVTWQPNSNTRIALVVRPVAIESGWFVASGRNMREVESRISRFTSAGGLILIATLVMSFILDFLGDAWRRRAMARTKS